jgi:hypothetical protein
MNAESLLSDWINKEFFFEISKELMEEMDFEPSLTKNMVDELNNRLENEWFRKYNEWTNEKIHGKTPL